MTEDAPVWVAGRGFARGFCDSPEWEQHQDVVAGRLSLGPFKSEPRKGYVGDVPVADIDEALRWRVGRG